MQIFAHKPPVRAHNFTILTYTTAGAALYQHKTAVLQNPLACARFRSFTVGKSRGTIHASQKSITPGTGMMQQKKDRNVCARPDFMVY